MVTNNSRFLPRSPKWPISPTSSCPASALSFRERPCARRRLHNITVTVCLFAGLEQKALQPLQTEHWRSHDASHQPTRRKWDTMCRMRGVVEGGSAVFCRLCYTAAPLQFPASGSQSQQIFLQYVQCTYFQVWTSLNGNKMYFWGYNHREIKSHENCVDAWSGRDCFYCNVIRKHGRIKSKRVVCFRRSSDAIQTDFWERPQHASVSCLTSLLRAEQAPRSATHTSQTDTLT